ncbi:adenylosuccinate lyase [Desulfurella sp.]|uniref:adenylosuccinate lyase n=1 Tax=Desulfurella sp. TaxID=1962857 RepID=UPI003D10F2E1
MIERYTRKIMDDVWTLENKYQKWLEVELAIMQAHEEMGTIPAGITQSVRKKAKFDVKRIEEIEEITRHDIVAFNENVREYLTPQEGSFLHYGVTSSDIVDTANALLLKRSCEIIIDDIKQLLETLKKRAFEFKDTPMIGRSHGIHAEPITFGFVIALWYEEMKRNLQRMEQARQTVSYGKISGSMGTFANVDLGLEERACEILGLKPDPISNQIIQRDRYAQYMTTLAIIAATIEKIALQIRHYQRTEVQEAEEYFHGGQKGSSSMPHKRNPVLSENLDGLARLVRSNALCALENVALWHERDISHSSNERIILPDSSIAIDFMLNRLNNILSNLVVYKEKMFENLNLTRGVIYSQRVMLKLIEKGLDKETAYKITQSLAFESWNNKVDYKLLLAKNEIIGKYLSEQELTECFDYTYFLRNIDKIFNRVFDK